MCDGVVVICAKCNRAEQICKCGKVKKNDRKN